MLLPLAVWAVSNLYDWRHKETDLLGKMMVAFSLSQLFVLGGVAVGPTGQPLLWTFAALIFLFGLGEKIAGGAVDMEGDCKSCNGLHHRAHSRLHCSTDDHSPICTIDLYIVE